MKNTTQHPLNRNGLVQWMEVGNSIQLKWFIIYRHNIRSKRAYSIKCCYNKYLHFQSQPLMNI